MRPFHYAFLFLLSLLVSYANASSSPADLSAAGSDGTSAVIVPLSEIRQRVTDNSEFHFQDLIKGATPGWDVASNASPSAPSNVNAPKLYRSFKGIGATSFEPADPSIAVGPDRVVAVVNRTIAIFTKVGQKTFQATLRDFFGSLPDSESVSVKYPKVMYDSDNGHFLVVYEAVRSIDKRSWYFLGVSRTSSPEGEWAFWELNMALNGNAQSGLFADYPGLGLDQQAIYLTANMATWASRFQYAKIRVLKKSEVYNFGKVTWHDFFKLTDATGKKAISIQPAQSFGTAPAEYMVSSSAMGGSKLTLWNITNPTLANAVLNKKAVAVTAYQLPPAAPQKGGSIKIGTGDASLINAVYRNGAVYTAHTIARGSASAIRYYQINTNGSVAQEVTYGQNGAFYYFPAVMVDSRGNAAVVFNRSGSAQFVGLAFTGRLATDSKNKLQSSASLLQGRSYYHLTARQVQYWGAYNGMALDYDDAMWMIGAYAKTGDEWDTWIGKVSY